MRFNYFTNCVSWAPEDVGSLSSMIDSGLEVTRRTFLSHVNPAQMRELETALGYERRGLAMAKDWHVSYYRGTLHDQRVYFFKWSAIEYVFIAVDHKQPEHHA